MGQSRPPSEARRAAVDVLLALTRSMTTTSGGSARAHT